MVLDWFRRKTQQITQVPLNDQRVRSRGLSTMTSPIEPKSSVDEPTPVALGAPARATTDEASIVAARGRFIVFRQFFPPPIEPGLSFYGGAPVAPAGMPWPRSESDGRPLTLIVQWDCAALSAQDRTGLMPRDGVLYLFSSFEWGDRMDFRFIHAAADGERWTALPIPADLPPAFGTEAAQSSRLVSPHVPPERQQALQLLPCWSFEPIAVDAPATCDDDDGDARFWADGADVKEAILRTQDPWDTPESEPIDKRPRFERPFPSFPQDWAAVRVIAAAALDKIMPTARIEWQWAMPDADDAMREALVATWRADAIALYDEAVAHSSGAAVPSERSDALWLQLVAMKPVFWSTFERVVRDAVNASLGLNSAGRATIPSEQVQALASAHTLATVQIREEHQHEFAKRIGLHEALHAARAIYRKSRSPDDLEQARAAETQIKDRFEQAKGADELHRVRDVWAPTPNRMFGCPSYVQGYVEEYVDDRLLLLELSGNDAIGFPLGEGVLQFMIRPEDLAARRFDRVETVVSGY